LAAHLVVTHRQVPRYERSSHTWFVLKYLLGYPDVKNYDGSWTGWGNLVRVPIERAAA
jgi:thiosulfate/3-mercaptopyruvate sulfurtransferase